jgi:hypothetical protein
MILPEISYTSCARGGEEKLHFIKWGWHRMRNYELLTSVAAKDAITSAKNALERGWMRRDYPLIRLDQPIPWPLIDDSLRSWNFYIHCWDMLNLLLAAYSEKQDIDLLTPCVTIAVDWSSRYGLQASADADTPFAWYDMAVGLRAYRLAYLLEAARIAGVLSEHDDVLLWSTLLEHQNYLSREKNIAFHNNHGYYQVAGQLAMGRRFRQCSPLMEQAYVQGKERLCSMLAQQFAADGVHREHSPDYHRMVLDTLSGLLGSGLVEDQSTMELAQRIEEALAWFVMPNQRLVNFGDSDYRDISRRENDAMRKWRTPAMRWQASGGKVGENRVSGLKRFDQGGYFIYRQPTSRFDEPSAYLAQTAAFHSRTHKHADDLSFVWFDRGEEVLVDAGRYGYIGKTTVGSDLWQDGHWYSDPQRVYCESTRAHNCLEFDSRNYLRKGIKPYGVALGRSLMVPPGLVVLETECRHFRGLRHARLLVLMPGQWLIVFDWFHDNLGASHEARQWFHLAESWQLSASEIGYRAVSAKTGSILSIVPLLPGSMASRPLTGGVDPLLQGWWSPSERQLLPNFAFSFDQRGAATGAFATLFSFASHLQPELTRSRVNASGRRFRLCWQDKCQEHLLDVERAAEGDMAVQYQSKVRV